MTDTASGAWKAARVHHLNVQNSCISKRPGKAHGGRKKGPGKAPDWHNPADGRDLAGGHSLVGGPVCLATLAPSACGKGFGATVASFSPTGSWRHSIQAENSGIILKFRYIKIEELY